MAKVFDAYPPALRAKLLRLRRLILDTAGRIEGAGPLTGTLKWGGPAYLSEAGMSGTTIRLGWKPEQPDRIAI